MLRTLALGSLCLDRLDRLGDAAVLLRDLDSCCSLLDMDRKKIRSDPSIATHPTCSVFWPLRLGLRGISSLSQHKSFFLLRGWAEKKIRNPPAK